MVACKSPSFGISQQKQTNVPKSHAAKTKSIDIAFGFISVK